MKPLLATNVDLSFEITSPSNLNTGQETISPMANFLAIDSPKTVSLENKKNPLLSK
jgi:hypothetical protein